MTDKNRGKAPSSLFQEDDPIGTVRVKLGTFIGHVPACEDFIRHMSIAGFRCQDNDWICWFPPEGMLFQDLKEIVPFSVITAMDSVGYYPKQKTK